MLHRRLRWWLAGGDLDVGAAHRARGVPVQPPVDARRVERVPARRQPPHLLPVPDDVDAHCALLRRPRRLAAVLERRDGLDVLLAEPGGALTSCPTGMVTRSGPRCSGSSGGSGAAL